MGFGGGGSNVTLPHTHDSTITQDGGDLAANITSFGLAAGSVLYSDGSNIQELVVGSPSNALQVNGAGTAPEWAAASGGTASSQSDRLASTFTTSSASFVTTGLSITENNNAGISIAQFNPMFGGDTTSNFGYAIFNDGVIDNMSYQMTQTGGTHPNGSSTYSHTADQSVLTARVAALEGGSLELEGSATFSSNFVVSEYG